MASLEEENAALKQTLSDLQKELEDKRAPENTLGNVITMSGSLLDDQDRQKLEEVRQKYLDGDYRLDENGILVSTRRQGWCILGWF